MSNPDLSQWTKESSKHLTKALDQLKKQLDQLKRATTEPTLPESLNKITSAADQLDNYLRDQTKELSISEMHDMDLITQARLFHEIQLVAHNADMLLIAYHQRLSSQTLADELLELDELVQSCYMPVLERLKPEQFQLIPSNILSISFQDNYLARPQGPVFYITLPNFIRGHAIWGWMGIGHETGHHVYRQVKGLRDELEVLIVRTLGLNGFPEEQKRLWLSYAEEVFADLYGVLTLGAAFVSVQQLILLYAPSQRAIHECQSDIVSCLVHTFSHGVDARHPIPLVRGLLGIYTYEHLLGDGASSFSCALLEDLRAWQNQVIDPLGIDDLMDPLSPKGNCSVDNVNTDKKLAQEETLRAMKLVVDTMLDTPLLSFGCSKLRQLLDFDADEKIRDDFTTNPPVEPSPGKKRLELAANVLREIRLAPG